MASQQNFTELEKLDIIYQSGFDSEGRPIIVFVGNKVETKVMDMDTLFLYLLKFLDPIVEKDYVCVFIQTGISSNNRPNMKWMKRIYRIFNRK